MPPLPVSLCSWTRETWWYHPAYTSVIWLLGSDSQDWSMGPVCFSWPRSLESNCVPKLSVMGSLVPRQGSALCLDKSQVLQLIAAKVQLPAGCTLPRCQGSEYPLEREGGPSFSALRCTQLLFMHSSSRNWRLKRKPGGQANRRLVLLPEVSGKYLPYYPLLPMNW